MSLIEKFATTTSPRCRNKSRLQLLVIFGCCFAATLANDNLRVAYQWKQVDFNYPSAAVREQAIATGAFIPENVIPVGLEVFKQRLFMTLPRWKTGVPASLVYIDMAGNLLERETSSENFNGLSPPSSSYGIH